MVIQILRFILFKPLPSSLYDRLFVDCFSPSFSRMKKRDREYINQIPDDAFGGARQLCECSGPGERLRNKLIRMVYSVGIGQIVVRQF